jgi:hypothetical protein
MELDETTLMEILREISEHEIQTRKVIDGLERKIKERDQLIDELMKGHQKQVGFFEEKFRVVELKVNEMSRELRVGLAEIKSEIAKKPVPIIRQIRFPLFPENNPDRFYKFVYGRLIWWVLALFICIKSFMLGTDYFKAPKVVQCDTNVVVGAKAWIYLYEHSNKSLRAKMLEAQHAVEKQP